MAAVTLGATRRLLRFDFPQTQIELMLDGCRDIQIGPTNNRSVLGSMNDMKQMIDLTVFDSGGLGETDMFELIRMLNHTSYKTIGYKFPVEKMQELTLACSSLHH